jgi:hypothetical protein
MNDHWNVLYQVSVFYVNRKSKMATTAGHRLTLDPMGKCSNAFFTETTNMIKAKLYINVYWMVLYKLIDANHYDFSVIVTNFGSKLRCYGQQSTCYGFPIFAGPEPFPI